MYAKYIHVSPLTITIIDDKRCNECNTDAILEQISKDPALSAGEIVRKDFSDSGVEKLLEKNDITLLPAILLNHNKVTGQVSGFLQKTPDNNYNLPIDSTFDPYAVRSERGFLVLEQETINAILSELHIFWNPDANVTWLEYSDVNCHYCKKMETDGTAKIVFDTLWEVINKSQISYISVGWDASQKAAEVLECIGKIGWSEPYSLSFSNTLFTGKNTTTDIIEFAKTLWVDGGLVQACYDAGETKEKVERQIQLQNFTFWQGGTPRNILINTETWEYSVLSWAYPANSFIQTIESLK